MRPSPMAVEVVTAVGMAAVPEVVTAALESVPVESVPVEPVPEPAADMAAADMAAADMAVVMGPVPAVPAL
jgi:hypothetical protein